MKEKLCRKDFNNVLLFCFRKLEMAESVQYREVTPFSVKVFKLNGEVVESVASKEEVQVIRFALDDLASIVGQATIDITNTEADVTTLQERVTQTETNVADLQGEVITLEARPLFFHFESSLFTASWVDNGNGYFRSHPRSDWTTINSAINIRIMSVHVDAVDIGQTTAPSAVRTLLPNFCLLYTSPSPRDGLLSRMPSSA